MDLLTILDNLLSSSNFTFCPSTLQKYFAPNRIVLPFSEFSPDLPSLSMQSAMKSPGIRGQKRAADASSEKTDAASSLQSTNETSALSVATDLSCNPTISSSADASSVMMDPFLNCFVALK